MEVIIIAASKYRDKDAVYTAITKNSVFTFYARGINTAQSKYTFLNTIFTKAKINLIEGKIKYPILESAELITSPKIVGVGLDYLQTLLAFGDLLAHSVEECDKCLFYDIISDSIDALNRGMAPLHVNLYFFLKILPIIGFEIEVNSCVNCSSKKNIADFSFVDGGFLCKDCVGDSERKYTVNQLKLIRNTICCKKIDELSIFDPKDSKFILKDVAEFLYEGLGYRNKNLDILLK